MLSRPANAALMGASAPPTCAGIDGYGDLSPLELYMLADDSPRFPRSFVVGLEFAGVIDRGAFERALAESLANEPRLMATVARRRIVRTRVAALRRHHTRSVLVLNPGRT